MMAHGLLPTLMAASWPMRTSQAARSPISKLILPCAAWGNRHAVSLERMWLNVAKPGASRFIIAKHAGLIYLEPDLFRAKTKASLSRPLVETKKQPKEPH